MGLISKKLFSYSVVTKSLLSPRACPTNGLDCGSLRDHNLTLFVITSSDSDGDGVDNANDKCENTPAGAKVNSQGCWFYNSVDFSFDSTTISEAYAPLFDNAISTLKRNSGLNVQLEGHTDSTGPEAYNQGLSERRAQAVKNHLIENGIAASRLTVKGFGEADPIASNDTAEGRAENRRVGFSITAR
ncbi:hypothetical protein BMR05_12250 [Methylococcaceae bacterium HT4]|nr:hypothetical protein BMR05_12250 [Methylococcaceae bacterium HT4]